jgi:hypothetical protein
VYTGTWHVNIVDFSKGNMQLHVNVCRAPTCLYREMSDSCLYTKDTGSLDISDQKRNSHFQRYVSIKAISVVDTRFK